MAQVSYGTITINDITDITDTYLQYCMVADNVTVNNISESSWFVLSSDTTVQNKYYYVFNSSDNQYHIVTATGSENPTSLGWYEDKPYPTWQSGYQIWIRQVTIKEGIDLPEYGTPYLDTAVNQINTSVINIDNRLKTFFYPGDITRDFSGAFVTGKTEAEGLVETNSNTYGFNTRVATGLISMGYNRLPLLEMGLLGNDFNGIKLYSPVVENSQITNTIKGLELSNNGLNFYNTNGDVISSFGNSISLASNGAAITIGSTSSYNTYINSQGLYLRNGITANATLDSNGLVLNKGGVIAGTASQSGFIYLSTESYGSYSINGSSGISDWKEIIGTKFGVRADGTLYANNAVIKGNITATSLTIDSGATVTGVVVPSEISDMATKTYVGNQGYQTASDVDDIISDTNVSSLKDGNSYATQVYADEKASDAEANASYSLEIKVTAINYVANTATLVAIPYYQGSITIPSGVTLTYTWYRDSISSSNIVGSNSNTLNVTNTNTMGLEHNYICVISKS